MKKMKQWMKRATLALPFALLLFAATPAQAQYTNAIGVRATGWSYGLTFKHMLGDKAGLELLAFSRWRGFNITGLYELHYPVITDGMRLYFGGGAHVGFFNGRYNGFWFDDNDNHVITGIDGIIGLEYTFDGAPINISLDWKPALNITGYTGFWGDEGGLGIRYTF